MSDKQEAADEVTVFVPSDAEALASGNVMDPKFKAPAEVTVYGDPSDDDDGMATVKAKATKKVVEPKNAAKK